MAEGRRTTADPPQEAGPGRKLEWEEFRRRVWLAAGVAVLVVGAGLVLVFAARVFLLAFAGIMLPVFLGGLAYYLRRWTGVPQRAALLTV
ncbi:MAG TPA: hypothetical protein VIL46_10165, partial [Gemmataceae bacterium]